MARSWHYPRWKRVALQVAMVVVLGVTLGLAELVVRHERTARRIVLAPPIRVGLLDVRFPDRWVVLENTDTRIVVQEPDGDRPGRQLVVVGALIVPPQYTAGDLVESINLPPWVRWQPADGTPTLEQVHIAGTPGLLAASRSLTPGPDSPDHKTRWLAAAVLRPGLAVSILMLCPDDTDPGDDKNEISAVLHGITLAK